MAALTTLPRPGEHGRRRWCCLTVDLAPTETGTRLRITQQTPGLTDEPRLATIAGWQTFLDVLTEVAEA
ncbi:MAG TPA: SRPBCC domain-containing protein [Microbacteriaceae bacterium]|nr:SRPBCC domain-containing protein [Microbacteriaceae bacterium]